MECAAVIPAYSSHVALIMFTYTIIKMSSAKLGLHKGAKVRPTRRRQRCRAYSWAGDLAAGFFGAQMFCVRLLAFEFLAVWIFHRLKIFMFFCNFRRLKFSQIDFSHKLFLQYGAQYDYPKISHIVFPI